MVKCAANLSHMWADMPYLDRFDMAAASGFDGVEVDFPYEIPAKETQRAALRCGLQMVRIAAPPPNYTGGQRGFAAVPGGEARFQYDLRRALRYCDALGVSVLHLFCGKASGPEAHEQLLANLLFAVDTVPKDLLLTLAPQDADGYFLTDYRMAAEIVADIGAPNIGLILDTATATALGEDPNAVISAYGALIRHVHLADAPGRVAPGLGALGIKAIRDGLRLASFTGWIGGAYACTPEDTAHLHWLETLRNSP